jgi:hypothetical protein
MPNYVLVFESFERFFPGRVDPDVGGATGHAQDTIGQFSHICEDYLSAEIGHPLGRSQEDPQAGAVDVVHTG